MYDFHEICKFYYLNYCVGFSGNFRNQNGGGGMGGRHGFMDQPGGMNRYPDSGSRDFSRPNAPGGGQFQGGSRSDRRPDFESLPPPPSKFCYNTIFNAM